jgi:hypothetical protein
MTDDREQPCLKDSPTASREADEAQQMMAAAELLSDVAALPRPLRAAMAHTLYAVAAELRNGRPLAVEVRRAARHLVRAVEDVASDRGVA